MPWPVLLSLVLAAAAHAAPISREDVPGPLQPWISWVLKGQEQALCPFFQGQERRDCSWPGALKLVLEEKTGRFEQGWKLQAEDWVFLPGAGERWPQDVRVDGAPAAVVRRGDMPALRLKPGAHVVSGTFRWDRLPEQLQIPNETGLLSLTARGAAVPFPLRDDSGRLWLQQKGGAAPAREEAHLEVSVHRRLTDDIPLQLVTRVQLKVSGANRETVLGRALPEGFTPMSLVSPLPARLDADGRLRVQARAGTWDLILSARREGPGGEIKMADPGGPWDDDEAWVFESMPALRQADLEGAPSLDPQQTELPGDWRAFPAFLVRKNTNLKIMERRRGDDPPAPDRLSIDRELWLDFDGGGFSARDQIRGTLNKTWRLESLPETKLGRVSIGGQDQFLTSLSSGGPAGLEVRSREIAIVADSRVESRRLPATGWRQDFESVNARLHLPPGWRLVHATGVDQASPTWIGNWTLLDFFLVLIAASAFSRLFGAGWGAAALAGVALAWHEPGAPRWVWLWLLLFTALTRALEEHATLAAAARLAQRLALGALALIVVPFLVRQARLAVYPILEFPYQQTMPRDQGQLAQVPAPPAAPEAMEDKSEADELAQSAPRGIPMRSKMSMISGAAMNRDYQAGLMSKRYDYHAANLNQMSLDPNARVTTGPGLPYWQWRTVGLSWKGPVPQDHTVSLWLLSPGASAAVAALRMALIVLLSLVLMGVPVGRWLSRARKPRNGDGDGGEALGEGLWPLVLALALLPATARAQSSFPPRELLDELRGRLLERPECAPLCAESPSLHLSATGSFLSLRLEVTAAAPTAVPIPSGGREWSPARVTLDGAPASVRRTEEGTLWAVLPAGAHQLALEGPLPDRDSVSLALPLKPRRVEASVTGWTLHGLREDGRSEDNLQLSRSRGSEPAAAAAARAQGIYPPFLRVERIVRLGLSWSVETRVYRLTPLGTPVTALIPLIPGESVTSPEPRVTDGKASLSLGPQAQSASWTSVLKETDKLRLEASSTTLWSESWRIEPGPLWHAKVKGIPPVFEEPSYGVRAFSFRPWPGEAVDVAISRPLSVDGQTLTIDQSVLALSPGLRAADATLALSVRSSRGGQHALALPEGSDLLSAKLDGRLQPLRLEGRKLTIPVQPGSHAVEIAWRQPGGATLLYRGAEADLGASSVNSHVFVNMPHGRWTLLLGGPGMGPAVVFWSLLAVFLLVSVGLGATELTPLAWPQWFLLSVGLTQASVPAAATVALWFLAVGYRGSKPASHPRNFGLIQVFLACLTVIAAACLFGSIRRGLLGLPDMQIQGNGSTAQVLRWYLDRSDRTLPQPWVLSTPLWVYRLTMLSWALWLANSMVEWARWAWKCYSAEGLWK